MDDFLFFFFFFQAEDGIRDGHVTGVQTCALPISAQDFVTQGVVSPAVYDTPQGPQAVVNANLFLPYRVDLKTATPSANPFRSEERRVGKECRARWSAEQGRKRTREEE